MTNYSKMSDEEINGAIAQKRGWHFSECIDCGIEYWETPDGGIDYNQSDPPNYTHNWNLCGELLEEIPFPFLHQRTVKLDWVCSRYDGYTAVTAPTPLRAICEEWLEWMCEQ